MTVRIVTDSACDLPADLTQALAIAVVPLRVIFGAQTFLDGIDLSPQEFFTMLAESRELPITSQPSPQQFSEIIRPLAHAGHPVLVLTLSSALSGTYQSALIGSQNMLGVAVVDSLLASAGLGVLVIRAAHLAAQGASLEQLVEFVEAEKKKIRVYLTLNDVERIVRGGRLSLYKARVNNPDINLIFTNNDLGQIEILERVRGKEMVLKRFVQLLADDCDWQQRIVAIAHSDRAADADMLADAIRRAYKPAHIIVREIGATIGTHTGQGSLIVAV